MSQFY